MSETDVEIIAENDNNRSKFIYNFFQKDKCFKATEASIPKVIMQYWHSIKEIPDDVSKCIESWKVLEKKGFLFELYDDELAKKFIRKHFDEIHLDSYLKCHHPAMRCDYFRLCYLYTCGGFYVDADELLLNKKIDFLFNNDNLKIQPLCYSIKRDKMIESGDFLHSPYDLSNIYYINNNPIISPPRHNLISMALKRATNKLVKEENISDIQSTTGPGNLSATLVNYILNGENEVEYIENWDSISKSLWSLNYRNDDRNWRLYDVNKKKWFDR